MKTKRLATVLSLAGALALTTALTACDGAKTHSLEEHLERAKQSRHHGDLRAAVLELKNALKSDPNAAAARFLLGQIYIDMEDGLAAEKELTLARQFGMNDATISVPLSRAWILQGEYEKVLQEVQIPANLPPRTRAALQVVHGDAYFGLGRLDEAENAFKAAIAIDPSETLAYVGLGNTALVRRDFAAAEANRQKALQRDPDLPRLIALEGDIASTQGNFERAREAYQRLVKLRPEAVLYRTALAWAQTQTDKLDDASKNIQIVLDVVPNYPAANHIHAVIAYKHNNYGEAADYAERALAVDGERLPSILILGAANYALGHLEQAYAALNRYVTAVPEDQMARKLLGRVQIALGHSDEAIRTLTTASSEKSDDVELLNLLASAAMQKGDLQDGRKYLQRSLDAEPDSASAAARLGMAEIASGNVERGLEELEKAVSIDPEAVDKRIVLALEYLRANKSDEALAAALQLQKMVPNKAVGFTLEGMVHGRKNDVKAAKASFEKALAVEPGNINASQNLARIAVATDQWADAERLLKDTLAVHPGDLKSLLLLADLAGRRNKPSDRRAYLDQALAANAEAREPVLLLAQDYLKENNYSKALEITRPHSQRLAKDSAFLTVVGRAQLGIGQTAEAITSFERLTELRPQDPMALLLLGTALETEGSFVRARDVLMKVLQISPKNVPARFGLARTKAGLGQPEEADALLSELIAEKPAGIDPADLYETKGYVALAKEDAAEAVKAFTAAFAARENSINARRLSEAQMLARNPEAALKTIKNWMALHPEDALSRFHLANLYLGLNQLDGAMKEYETLLAKDRDNALVLNNLAWTYYKLQQPEKALVRIEQAVKLRSDLADVQDTAGMIYLALKRPREAALALRKATDLAPEDGEIRQRYAEALIADGRPAEAREVLKDLLSGAYALADRDGVERRLLQLSAH